MIAAGNANLTSDLTVIQDSEEIIPYDGTVVTSYFNIDAFGVITCLASGSYFMEFDAQVGWVGVTDSSSVGFYYRVSGNILYNDVTYVSVNNSNFASQYTRSLFLTLGVGQTVQWFYYQPSVLGSANTILVANTNFPATANANAASVKFWLVAD
jgi:hypothetical protein